MPRNRQSHQLADWNDDPFEDMRRMHEKMMRPFGGNLFGGRSLFDHDDFFSDFDRQISRNFDRFNMDDIDTGGQYVMQSYTSKTVIGPDGKPVTEKNIKKETSAIGNDGKRIVEKDHVYKHTGQNIKKVEKERQLGDQKIKVVREVRDNEHNEYRDLENLDEHDVQNFNNKFNQYAQDTGMSRFNQIGYDRSKNNRDDKVRAIRH